EMLRAILRRHRSSSERPPLIAALLEARCPTTGAPIGERQILDELLTILMAGHETTAVVLGWAWHLLSRDPIAEARLHEEVDRVLGNCDRVTPDIDRLAWTRQCIAETLRLFPPAWTLSRDVTRSTIVGDLPVAKGATLAICQYTLHRDARFWREPHRFDPARFAPGWEQSVPRGGYVPFSTGRRGCVGEHFGWAEAVLVLATIARRWRLERVGDARYGLRPTITLKPDRHLLLRAIPR
ncbi:MAG: cytochrome P450, partial [Longimicrobiales bacterium]